MLIKRFMLVICHLYVLQEMLWIFAWDALPVRELFCELLLWQVFDANQMALQWISILQCGRLFAAATLEFFAGVLMRQ